MPAFLQTKQYLISKQEMGSVIHYGKFYNKKKNKKKIMFCWKGILCYQINKKGETRVINIVGSNNHGKQGFREMSAKLLKAVCFGD